MEVLEKVNSVYCRLALVEKIGHGVIYVQMNKEIPTRMQLLHLRKIIEDLAGTGKHRFLIDTTKCMPLVRSDRLMTDDGLGEMAERIAFVHHSELGRMIARLFTILSDTRLPMQMFENEDIAMNWLLAEEE